MKNTGQELALRHVVRPERWHFAVRGSHPAAEKSYSRSARPYACPGPAPHVKCPIAPRNALGISDSQTRAGSSRAPGFDSERLIDIARFAVASRTRVNATPADTSRWPANSGISPGKNHGCWSTDSASGTALRHKRTEVALHWL